MDLSSKTVVHVWSVLERAAKVPAYPLVVGVIACLSTLSMTVAFAPILFGAVLLNRQRWVVIVVVSSFGSALGGVLLFVAVEYLGWKEVAALYPSLTRSDRWSSVMQWVSAYGPWAVLALAASPLPQTPALVLAAILRVSWIEIFVALFCGKLLKYGLYGYLAAKFPNWRWRQQR